MSSSWRRDVSSLQPGLWWAGALNTCWQQLFASCLLPSPPLRCTFTSHTCHPPELWTINPWNTSLFLPGWSRCCLLVETHHGFFFPNVIDCKESFLWWWFWSALSPQPWRLLNQETAPPAAQQWQRATYFFFVLVQIKEICIMNELSFYRGSTNHLITGVWQTYTTWDQRFLLTPCAPMWSCDPRSSANMDGIRASVS